MIQAIIKKGRVFGEHVSAPIVSKGNVLIKVVNSCISAGTEMAGVESSGTPLIKRSLKQPQKVKKVIDWVKTEGIETAYRKVTGELSKGSPTGYSISGIVIGVGKDVNEFKIGDRVAAGGGGLANHAEYVNVPINLVVKIPHDLDFLSASSVALGSIAMHGIRRSNLKFGEYGVVLGTGILGLLSVKLLVNSGIRVAAIDINEKRLEIAQKYGAEITLNPTKMDVVKMITNWANGYGADAVIFTAASKDDQLLSQSFQMCRRKGKVVLVGTSGMNIDRKDIYPKEIDFLISTSYGPGRYDKNYELEGVDYPYAYVRWTENRNMREYLRILSNRNIDLDYLVSKVFPIDKVSEAFEHLKSTTGDKPLMVFLDYGKPDTKRYAEYSMHNRKIIVNKKPVNKKVINIGLIGAGNFATGMHLPNIQKLKDKFNLHAVASNNGNRAKEVVKQYNASYATTNYNDILNDENIDLVLICTRHGSHAKLVLDALKTGKNVFVEKPLAINQEELKQIKDFYSEDIEIKPILMVGFNRRFSRYAEEIKKHVKNRINPLFIHYRMNAGFIPLDHWVHKNGGRIIGEGCHIIDLMTYFTENKIKTISFDEMTPSNEKFTSSDNKSIILKYDDGSIATIEYFAVGSKQYSKEYMEIHFDEKTIIMDNYKSLKGFGIKIKEINTKKSQKGQLEEIERLYNTLTGRNPEWPIPLWDMIQTTEATIRIITN
ncbi:MAG: bi-domain-containing oxidoreductase [Candidatus Marinimicrobia bacterium]|nr:bi-domain-containing oxidoreductase [Candidatus Neomarinimicrobiota bacterium]